MTARTSRFEDEEKSAGFVITPRAITQDQGRTSACTLVLCSYALALPSSQTD